MKSIRLSLLLYFLLLLAVALGAISVWAYQHTQRILAANVRIQREFLRQQYTDACEEVNGKFDNALLQKAQNLASQAKVQFDMNRSMAEIQFREDVLPPLPDDQYVSEYFQINSERLAWHSPSMGDRSFPFDLETYKSTPLHVWHYEDTELQPGLHRVGTKTLALLASPLGPGPLLAATAVFPGRIEPILVRRVTLKAPIAWRPSVRFQPDVRRPRPPPPEPGDRPTWAIYIQCAAKTTQRDAKLAELREQLDNDLASLNEDSQATLSTFRNRLLLIVLGTFAATVAGGVWLVRLGLSPLQRLSVAVSQVSPKDFRLPFDEKPLPQELRPIVERLTQTLELLKRTFAREKQAAADISHELRTPLAALLTTIEVALRKPRSTEEYRELLTDCHATGLQMSQLIERLLALARLDAGVDNLRPREVDASSVAEQCATLVRPLVDARGLTLHVDRNGPVVLHTDPDKLREILTNLLHNAIEYNRPQGSIELALERHNGHVLLEVKDTGIGIAPEAREHIFERFYRADPSRQADGLHAGIGLAIVKGYVDLMGGTIHVESTEGQGTTFRIELPAR